MASSASRSVWLGFPDCLLEIAPAFALEKDDIKEKLSRIPTIKPKDKLYLE